MCYVVLLKDDRVTNSLSVFAQVLALARQGGARAAQGPDRGAGDCHRQRAGGGTPGEVPAGEVAESQPWSVAEWAVALRFDNLRATVLVLLLGDTPLRVLGLQTHSIPLKTLRMP